MPTKIYKITSSKRKTLYLQVVRPLGCSQVELLPSTQFISSVGFDIFSSKYGETPHLDLVDWEGRLFWFYFRK